MKSLFTSIVCCECNHQMDADPFAVRCPNCGSAWLDARYDCAALRSLWANGLEHRPTTLWRYAELLPFPDDFRPVSMGEG